LECPPANNREKNRGIESLVAGNLGEVLVCWKFHLVVALRQQQIICSLQLQEIFS